MMTGHRHSARTPGLLRPLKKPGTFKAQAQQRHILRLWPKRGKKGPSSDLKKRTNVRAPSGRKEGWGTTDKESRRSKRSEGGPTSRPPKTRSHYEHIKKPQAGAIRRLLARIVFPSIYATSNVNKPLSPLYPLSLPSFLFVPAVKSPLSFCLLCLCHPSLFSEASYYGASLRLHCRDPINQCKIFALTGLTERPRSHLWALKRVVNIANKKHLTVAN